MYKIQRNPELKAKWWEAPELPKTDRRISRRQAERLSDETEIVNVSVRASSQTVSPGKFKPSRQWKPYSHIGVDHGYMCPLYSLKEIAYRYGLSQKATRYWRRHVLPEPIDVVLRRGIRSHHWSKIQLIVLDEVLLYLEKNGHQQINLRYDDAIDLFLYGCDVLTKFYREKYEAAPMYTYDRFGVRSA